MPGRTRLILTVTSHSAFSWKQLVIMTVFIILQAGTVWAQGKIYTWTDKNGVVHFSDSVTSPQDFGQAKTVTIQSRSTTQKGKGSDEIPLVTFADRPSQKFVRAQLEGGRETRDILMLVDTGAQISLVDQQIAKDLELEHIEEATLRGVNGVTQSWIGRLPSLRLGDEEVTDLRVMVGPQPGLVLLGMDVLDRLKLSVGPQSLHRR